MVFSVPVISQIESIVVGGLEWGGSGWGAEGNHSDSNSSAVPSVCDINRCNSQARVG